MGFGFRGGSARSLRARFGTNSKDDARNGLEMITLFMLRCVPSCEVIRLPEVWVVLCSHDFKPVGKLLRLPVFRTRSL